MHESKTSVRRKKDLSSSWSSHHDTGRGPEHISRYLCNSKFVKQTHYPKTYYGIYIDNAQRWMWKDSPFLATIREPLLALRPFDCCVIKCQEISSWHLEVHLRSPRLLCVRSLGSPWYDYVYFNSASSGIQWVVSLLRWLTKLSVLNVPHYATMNNKTSVKHNWRCFESWSVIGRIESVRVQSTLCMATYVLLYDAHKDLR